MSPTRDILSNQLRFTHFSVFPVPSRAPTRTNVAGELDARERKRTSNEEIVSLTNVVLPALYIFVAWRSSAWRHARSKAIWISSGDFHDSFLNFVFDRLRVVSFDVRRSMITNRSQSIVSSSRPTVKTTNSVVISSVRFSFSFFFAPPPSFQCTSNNPLLIFVSVVLLNDPRGFANFSTCLVFSDGAMLLFPLCNANQCTFLFCIEHIASASP